jgi:hypothetical protein
MKAEINILGTLQCVLIAHMLKVLPAKISRLPDEKISQSVKWDATRRPQGRVNPLRSKLRRLSAGEDPSALGESRHAINAD